MTFAANRPVVPPAWKEGHAKAALQKASPKLASLASHFFCIQRDLSAVACNGKWSGRAGLVDPGAAEGARIGHKNTTTSSFRVLTFAPCLWGCGVTDCL